MSVNNFTISTAPKIEPYYTVGSSLSSNKINITSVVAATGLNVRSHSSNLTFAKDAIVDMAFASGCYVAVGTTDKVPPTSGTLIKISQDGNNWKWVRSPQIGNYESLVEKQTDGGVAEPPPFDMLNAVEILQSGEAIIGGKGTGKNAKNLAILTNTKEVLSSSAAPKWVFPSLPFTSEVTTLAVGVTSQPAWFFHKGFFSTDVNNPQTTRVVHDLALVTLANQAIVSKTNAISGQYQMVRNTKGILYSEDFGISWLKTNVPNNFLKPGMTSNWNDQIFIYDSLSAYGPLTFPLAANFPILSSSLPSEITNLAAANNNLLATTLDGNIYTKNFVSTSWTKSNFDPFQYNQVSNGSFLLTLKGVSVSDNAAVACVATDQQIFTSSDLFSQNIQMFNPSGFFIEKTQIQSTGNTDRRWSCIAMSHSGQYQTAGANDDLIYTSNDYGNTWTQRGTLATMKRKWKAIAMSASGSRQVAVSTLVSSTTDLGEVWMSTDYGTTWTRITNGTLNNNKINFQDAAMSGDGTVIAVASANTNGTNNVDGGGMLWISINSGSTWNERGGGLDNSGVSKENRSAYMTSINSIAMSQDGVKMAYSCSNWTNTRGYLEGEVGIMVSTDTGKTWNRTPATQDSQRYLKSFSWPHVRMSSDGGVLIAHSPYMFSPPTDAAPFWISKDFGTTWTKTRPLGINANYPQGCSAITPDGMTIVLVHPSFGSYFFISSDSGNTWASKNIRRGFNNVAISSNGKRIAFSCDNTGYNGPVSLITQTCYHLSADMEFNYRTSIANFTNVFVSGNGQKITAVAKANPYPKQNETTILVQSNDAGTTWSFAVSALMFLDGTGTLGRVINFPATDSSNIAMSYDGEYQLVTATVPSLGQDIYNNVTYIAIKSSEYGVWTPVLSSVNKFLSHEQAACAVSRDGSQQHLFAERIHVSKNFGSTFEAQPTRLDPDKFNQNWTKPNIKTNWNSYRVIAQGPKMPELILGTALTNAVPKSYILMPTRYWPLDLSRGSYQRRYVDDKITNFIPVYNINTVGNQLSASGLRRWSKVVSSEYGEIGQYGQFVTGITSNVELSNWNSSITPPINSDGIFTSDNASSLYTSLSWTQRNPATLNWMDIAMSSSGQYQTMVPKNGTIFVSSNYGFTWATKPATALTKNWKFVLMSTDGKIQLAGGAAALYYSGDFGVTWTVAPTVPATSVIIDASMSADGKNQTIITENGQIYSSFNYGAAWALNSTLGTRNWTTVDMASAGDIQFVSDSFGEIYRFTEYDGLWTLVSPVSTERVFPITTPTQPTEFKRSLRFRSAGSAFLNRTPTVNSTSETKRTFSAWIKRGALSPSGRMILFYQGVAAGNGQMFLAEFNNDTLRVIYDGGATITASTVATFTDTTSWHHVLVVSDTTNVEPSRRTLIYFDGILQTTTGTPPSQNYTAVVGTTSTHRIGGLTSNYFDGYMADVYFVDGQALTPNDFGYQLPVPNLWAPKAYTGTYGANGFYLNFADNSAATSATIGRDYSGNYNSFTTNGVSLVVGSNWDSMVDNPISHGSAPYYYSGIQYPYNALNFGSNASAYLSRTPSTVSNRTTWTWSGWVKRRSVGTGASQTLFDATGTGININHSIRFLTADTLSFYLDNTSQIITTNVFRDLSVWYHVVAVWDTTNATSNDRAIIYVNGIRQDVTGTYPNQNINGLVNGSAAHNIGRMIFNTADFLNGILADVNFIDGQALTPASFGETINGTWVPKTYTGTYGTNGFNLKFDDNSAATAAALGRDSAGINNWTPTNFATTDVISTEITSRRLVNPSYGLQFRSGAFLTRTPINSPNAMITSRRAWTISFWVKRTIIGTGDSIFHQGPDQNNFANISFGSDNKLYYQNAAAGTVNNELITAQTFTDTSKWYHIVVACNTTATIDAEKMKIYVDGAQITSFSKATYPATNFDTIVNSIQPIFIGRNSSTGIQHFEGVLAEFYLIDGHALEPSQFGQNLLGTWLPKTYTYSIGVVDNSPALYGFQGFYLNFADKQAVGKSATGSNNFTPNNFLFADAIDFNATAVRGNYTTLSTLNKRGNATLTNANLTVNPLGSDGAISSNFQIVSGQWYWEVTPDTSTGGSLNIGIVNQNNTSWNTGDSINGYVYNSSQGQKFYNSAYTTYGASFGTGDVVGVAFDATAKTLTFYKNGVSQGVAFTGISTSVTWDPCVSHNGSTSSRIVHINFGQRPFAYTPPAGFSGLVRQIGYKNVGLRPAYKQVKVSPDGGLITAVASLCSHISFDKGNNWTLFDGISSGIFDIQNVYAGTSPTSAIVIGIKDNQYARFLVQPTTITRDTTNVVLAGSTDGKIALSNNNGRNWTLMPKATNPFESNATAAVVKKIKYVRNNDRVNNEGTFEVVGGVAASKGIYATASWLNPQIFVANAFIPTANAAQVINTVVNTEAGVFIGGDGGLVARSTNALKTTWAAETPNFGTSPIRAMEAVRPERSTATKVIAVGDSARVTIRQPSGVWDVFSLSANLVPITNGVVGSDSTSLAGGLSASAPNFVGGLKYILKTSPPVPFGITNNVTETFKIGGESQTVLQPSLFRQISALPGNIPDGDSQGWGRVTLDTTEYASGTTSVLRIFEITFSGDLNASSFVSLKIQNPSAITVVDTRIRNNQKYTYNSAPMSGEWTITVTHDYGVNVIKKTISTSGTATTTTRETYNNVPNLIDSTFTNSLYLSSVVADWDYGVTTSRTGDQISINYSPNIDNVSIKKYRQNPKIHYGLNNFYITGLSAGPMEISDKNANKFTSLLKANSHKPEIYLSDGDIVSVPVIGISNQDLPLIRFNSKIYNIEGEPYVYSPLVNSSVTEGSVVFPYQWNASSMSKDGKVVVVTGGLSIFNTTYTENDFYKYSVDGGITWSDPIYAGANTKLSDVAVSGDGNVIYIITQKPLINSPFQLAEDGLLISRDQGRSWTKKVYFTSLINKGWSQIRTNRDGSKVLITAKSNSLIPELASFSPLLYFSTNHGYSFNTITFGNDQIKTCAISENGKLMVVGRETNKVFYTTDNWKTRTEKVLTTAGNQINSLVATDSGTIIAVGENLLQFTKDTGGSWFNLNSPGSWNSVAVSPNGVHTIVVGNTGKVLISRTAELDGWFSPSALWNQASTGATEYSFGQEPTPPNYTTDVLKSLLWNSSTLRGISNQNSISWSRANIDATGKKVFLVGKYTNLSTSIYDVEGKLIASPFVLGSTPVAQTPVAYISLPVIQKAGEKLLKLQGASERINSNSVSYNGFVWNSISSPLSGVPTGISTNRTGAAYTNDKLLIVGSSEYYQYTSLSNTTNNFELTGLTNETTIEYGLSSYYPLTEINRELSGTRIGERYGESIALSKPGGLLVVGAPNNNELPPRRTIQEVSMLNTLDYLSAGTGKVDIYQFNLEKEEWSKTSTLYGISEKSRFGYSVSVDEDEKTIAIGAPGNLTLFDRTLTNSNLYGSAVVNNLPISLASQYGKQIGSGAIGPTSSLTTTSRAASISLLPPGYVFTKFDNNVNKEIKKAVMSRDGKFLIIFETEGSIYDTFRGVSVSSDFGKTFTSKGITYDGSDRGQATVYNKNSCGAISTNGQYQTIGVYDRYNRSRVFRSSNSGAIWTSVSVGFVTGNFEDAHKGDPICIGMSTSGQYQIIGTDGWQVFTSNDYGANWTQRTVASTGQNFYDVAVSDSGQYQTITTDKKIWISNDYGVTWIEKLTDNYWTQTAMSSDGKNRIVVSGVNGKVFVSTDFGANWSDKTTQAPLASGQYNLAGWFHARMSPDGSKMYIGDGLGIFWYSTNNGDTWRRLGQQTSNSVETFFVINNGDKLAMLASSGGYDYMWYSDSTTAGRIGTLPFAQFSSVVASSAGDVVMTTAEHNSIWTLSGYPLHPYQDWAQVNFDRNYGFWTSMRMTKSGAYAVACCGRNNYYESNKFEYSGVFTAKLVNGALTWSTNDILAESTYGSGLTSKFHWTGCAISDNANIITVVAARKVANSITNNGLIVCLSATAQANTTSGTDRAISPNGLTMKVTARINDTAFLFTDVAMNSSGAIQLAARKDSTLLRSVDFGVNWTSTGNALAYKTVYVSPKGDLQIAGTTGGQIYVSTNAGETWTARGASKRWTGFDATPDGSVIVAAAEAVATYTSFGAAVAGQPTDLISVNPDDNGTILTNENIQGATATLNSAGGLHYSFDRGTTWTTAISGTSQAMWSGVAITSDGRKVIASRRVPYAAYRLSRPTSSTSTAFFETSTIHGGVTTYDGGLSANEVIAGTEPPGYVQVYSFSNNQWSQKGQTLYGEWPGENFGGSVSLNTNGNVLIVGSPFAPKTISSNLEWKVGSAKVYTYNSQTNSWNLSGTKFEGEVANASLGTSVSINQAGNVVAMGSPNSDAKIYSWVPTVATPHGSWVLRGTKLTGTKGDPTGVAGFGLFGSSLQLNNEGDRIIIGAPDATVSGVANVGTALIYQWNTPTANAWNFVYEISGGHSNSFYRSSVNVNSCNLGYSVAINGTGNIIAAGGPGIRSTAFLSPEVHYVNFDNNSHEVLDLKERPYPGVFSRRMTVNGTQQTVWAPVPNTLELKPLPSWINAAPRERVVLLATLADPSIPTSDPTLIYQWYSTAQGGGAIRGANQRTLVMSGVSTENIGKYWCIVTRGKRNTNTTEWYISAEFNGRSTDTFLTIQGNPYQRTSTDPRQGFYIDVGERQGYSIALNGSGTSLLFGAIGFDNEPDRTDGYGAVYSYNLPKRLPYKPLWTTKRHTNATTPLIANYSTSTQNAPRCVAASPTEFVVGTTGKLVYSTNAETWNPVVIQNSTQTATVTLPHVTFNSIAYGGGYFCAVGTHGTIVVSNSANTPDKMFVIDGGSSTLSAQGHTFTQVIYNKLANTFVATGTKDLVTIRPDTVVSRVPTQNNTYNYFSIPSKPLTFLRDYNTNPDNPVSIASSGSTIVGVGRYGEITKINLF